MIARNQQRCPSCGGVVENRRCSGCGAEFDGARWRPERGLILMGKTIAKAVKENFVLCPTCSEEQGREVLVEKSLLRIDQAFLDEPRTICPKGHLVEVNPA